VVPPCARILAVLTLVLSARIASADHDPDLHMGTTHPPTVAPPPMVPEHMPELMEMTRALPPFLRDTRVALHLRTFVLDRENTAGGTDQAWALGGALAYRSGWLSDVLRVGAVGYTSQPLVAPADRDGALLLGPGQRPLLVLGQAWAQLRDGDVAVLTGYRQLVNQGYTNARDNRMIPNTFEGVTLSGGLGPLAYHVGYLTAIKARDSDTFVNMAAHAGVRGHAGGQLITSLAFTAPAGLDVYVANYLVPDVFNTAYANVELGVDLSDSLRGLFGVQLTDQRSVGAGWRGHFATWNVGARAQLTWRGWSLIGAMSATGGGAALRTPYGAWPGYLSLIGTDFDRAGEKAWGVGVGYDWSARMMRAMGVSGLSTLAFYAEGTGARDPASHRALPDRREGDLDVIWRPRQLRGFQLRLRNAYLSVGGRIAKEVRLILDQELPLFCSWGVRDAPPKPPGGAQTPRRRRGAARPTDARPGR
jgi:hypothetical protein